jgi:hypothetical protein
LSGANAADFTSTSTCGSSVAAGKPAPSPSSSNRYCPRPRALHSTSPAPARFPIFPLLPLRQRPQSLPAHQLPITSRSRLTPYSPGPLPSPAPVYPLTPPAPSHPPAFHSPVTQPRSSRSPRRRPRPPQSQLQRLLDLKQSLCLHSFLRPLSAGAPVARCSDSFLSPSSWG